VLKYFSVCLGGPSLGFQFGDLPPSGAGKEARKKPRPPPHRYRVSSFSFFFFPGRGDDRLRNKWFQAPVAFPGAGKFRAFKPFFPRVQNGILGSADGRFGIGSLWLSTPPGVAALLLLVEKDRPPPPKEKRCAVVLGSEEGS